MLTKALLYYEHSEGVREEHFLSDGSIIIGRDAPADIILLDAQVSRRHARIDVNGNGYSLIDLGSTNGTFLNDEPIGTDPVPLNYGDEIDVGRAITLHFNEISEVAKLPSNGNPLGVWIDPDLNTVWVDGILVTPPLSASQLDLVQLLYKANGTFVSREEIIANVWADYDPLGISDEAIHGLVQRLRQRLLNAQPGRNYLEELQGVGLRLQRPE